MPTKETIELHAELRDLEKEKPNALRREGFLPASVYGPGKPNQHLKLKLSEFERVYKKVGLSELVMLKIDGQSFNVLIREVDRQAGKYLHAAFLQLQMDKPIEVDVALNFVGEAPAVDMGGSLSKELDELSVECLPKDLVQSIDVDLSVLEEIGSEIRVSDIKLPPRLTLLTDPGELVARVVMPTVEEEEAPAAEEPSETPSEAEPEEENK